VKIINIYNHQSLSTEPP